MRVNQVSQSVPASPVNASVPLLLRQLTQFECTSSNCCLFPQNQGLVDAPQTVFFSLTYQRVDDVPQTGFQSYQSKDDAPQTGFQSYQGVDDAPQTGFQSYKRVDDAPQRGFQSYQRVDDVPQTGFQSYQRVDDSLFFVKKCVYYPKRGSGQLCA